MPYDVNKLAEEFSVLPEELHEIFDTFFDETAIILEKCEATLNDHDLKALAQLGHDLKGSAANLRMEPITELASVLETTAKAGNLPNCSGIVTVLARQVAFAQNEINAYYERKGNA